MHRRSFLIGSATATAIMVVSPESFDERVAEHLAGKKTYVDYGLHRSTMHVHQLSQVIAAENVMHHDQFIIHARAGDKIGPATVLLDGLYMRRVVQLNNEIITDRIYRLGDGRPV